MNSEDPLSQYDFQAGATLLVDKPKGWTSFDVVNKLRYKIKHRLGIKKIKVGHAGTLDPMATGLLIICTGKFTKKLADFQVFSKEYTGEITLGATTPSFDAETEIDQTYPTGHIDNELVEYTRKTFLGDLEQYPPMFSAIKVDGQPLYKKARQGIVVEVKPRPVTIYDFEVTNVEVPKLHFRIKCSKGTYIRSIAYDFGKAVQSGGYLTELTRTKIGKYHLENAWNLEDLVEKLENVTDNLET
ncbi:MAG: tRNA pseudouridine55 synthase [Saprospiraceae bacterium]|jgi:tRNA pseudouridine55 synthase